MLQQQARFDTFIQHYNHERPHQALEMATPASRYQPSTRPYQGVTELEHPAHDWTAVVTRCGRICYQGRKINLSQVFVGQKVGVRQADDNVWLVSFMEFDLGYFDDEVGPRNRVLPMSPEWTSRRLVPLAGFEPAILRLTSERGRSDRLR